MNLLFQSCLILLCLIETSCFTTQYMNTHIHKHTHALSRYKMCSSNSLYIDMSINDDNLPYLEKLEKSNKDKIQRLKSVRDNISKFLNNNTTNPKNTTNTQTRLINNPIMHTDFDKLFLNLNNIQQIYMTNDYDRAVFFLNNGQRYVFFVRSKEDKELIEKIIKFVKHPIRVSVMCDKTLFTDKFKYLYCEYMK